MLANFLQLANPVISEVANGSGGKWRQAGQSRRTMLPQQFLHNFEDAALMLLALPASLQQNLVAACPYLQVRPGAQKCVASNLLSALDGFEQESVRLVGRDGEKSGNRRQQVSRNRLDHRDQRKLAGQARKFPVIGA